MISVFEYHKWSELLDGAVLYHLILKCADVAIFVEIKFWIKGYFPLGGKFQKGKTGGWLGGRLVILPKKEGRGGSVNGKPLFVPVVLGWPVNLWSDEIL
ncbi:hypothetical protein TNCV_1373031 [Trichonephila clavipes]|uniref:Uncharacterized protein n=1 Tax=Trichonephila clavipes TaxID=2585209 RepID=A0A8X6WGF8_TRICX|nr:hypothetical protein TNCV_1373031 [Trichonephila clavipes]